MNTQNFKIAVVAPLHKVPKVDWLNALIIATINKADIILVDDSPAQGLAEIFPQWKVYNRSEQKEILGDKYAPFAIFHKSSACRNIGNYIAWKENYDIIIGLDSDCNVPEDFIDEHVKALTTVKGYGWTNPIKRKGWFPRGYPYAERERKIIANLGLWNHVLDIGGKDRSPDEPTEPNNYNNEYAYGNLVAESFIPFSGMNWAMWREAMPGFLFLPNFNFDYKDESWKFRRHDDIWGGYIFEKLMELRNERMSYGNPMVYHDTIIDKQADMDEEHAMIEFENTFFGAVDQAIAKVEPGSYEEMMFQFSQIIEKDWESSEWQPLIAPTKWWAELFMGL